MSLLDIKDVDISYGKNLTVKKVSMSLEKGEICSIVGESGSGKTTVIRAAMGLLPGGGRVSAGSITYDGMDLLGLTHEQWRELRGHDISMIFQDSGAMMNQTRLIGDSYVEYIRTHEDISKEDAWAKGVEMIERMRLPDGDLAEYRRMCAHLRDLFASADDPRFRADPAGLGEQPTTHLRLAGAVRPETGRRQRLCYCVP